MSPTATPDSLAELSFELDGFQWAGEERLEVSGRWFGVRGRRFVRPTLTLRAGGRRRRLVALLERKPWAAGWPSAGESRGPPSRRAPGPPPSPGAATARTSPPPASRWLRTSCSSSR